MTTQRSLADKMSTEESLQYSTSHLGTTMVTFFVGPKKTQFLLHKDLVCDAVPVFKCMFDAGFQESTTLSAKLPEDDDQAFNALVGWLYSPDTSFHSVQPSATVAVRLYCLAEKYCIDLLLDKIMNYIVEIEIIICKESPIDLIKEAYLHSRAGSKLRLFMIRLLRRIVLRPNRWSYHPTGEDLYSVFQIDDIVVDFYNDQLEASSRAWKRPVWKQRCDYHVHSKGTWCQFANPVFRAWDSGNLEGRMLAFIQSKNARIQWFQRMNTRLGLDRWGNIIR